MVSTINSTLSCPPPPPPPPHQAPQPATLGHPSSSINLLGGSMLQRITKSYQPKPCQISKHNHYVNPSLPLPLHREDGLSLWSSPPDFLSTVLEEEAVEADGTGRSSLSLNLSRRRSLQSPVHSHRWMESWESPHRPRTGSRDGRRVPMIGAPGS